MIIKARSNPTDAHFLRLMGFAVMVSGSLVAWFWNLLGKIAKQGLLMLADIADALFVQRKTDRTP